MADPPPATSDVDLVEAAARGDHAAFTELVKRHDRDLRGVVYRTLGDVQDMQDAMQNIYVKAYASLHAFRREASFRTWLFQIAHNTCTDRLRQRVTRPPVATMEEAQEVAASGLGDPTTRLALAGALEELSADHRAVVLTVLSAGFSYDEAGVILGVSAGTVASRLSHARANLQRNLVSRGVTSQ